MGQPGAGVDAGQFVDASEQIDGIDGPLLDLFALFVRGADHAAALESAARHQDRKHLAIMVPAAVPGGLPVDLRTAPEFAAAPDNRRLQQPVIAQVLEQHCQPLVQLGRLPAHRLEVVFVGVPAAGIINYHVGNAGLDEPPRHQALLAEGVAPVAIAQLRLLLREIEDFLAGAEDQLIGLLLGLCGGNHLGAGRHQVAQRVHFAEQFAAGLLAVVGDIPSHDAFDFESHGVRVAAGGKRLELRPQETLLGEPPLRLGQHDVGGNHAGVSGAFEQREDGADARIGEAFAGRVPGLHQVGRRFMAVVSMRHAADEGILVGLLGQFGKQRADLDAVDIGGDHRGELSHVFAARLRFGIPCVVVRHAAPEEYLDD